jgi:antitoxin component YwqK of YwqJK toxin-antitoxin module
MDIATIAYALYKEYIDDIQYVYYKEHGTIIIMKVGDDLKCVSVDVEHTKYFGNNLKVVVMFDLTDPYKLVSHIGKYRIDECINSYCYKKIEDVYELHQTYHSNGQKRSEGFLISEKIYGFWQVWTDKGELRCEGYYKDGNEHGLVTIWNNDWEGDYKMESYYNNGRHDGITRHYHDTGELHIEGHYKNSEAVGQWLFYKKTGEIYKTKTY